MQTGILEADAQLTDQEWINEAALNWLERRNCYIVWDYDLKTHRIYGFHVYNFSTRACLAAVTLPDRTL